MVKAPARDPSDFCMARSAQATLFIPEEAKRTSAPKRFLHMGFFAFFEVGLIGRVVGVRVSFDFNVSLDGSATGGPQPNLNGLALVITRFTEEGPVTTTTRRKVLLFAPACVLVRVSSSSPLPHAQSMRTTAVADVTEANGASRTLVSSSERALSPGQRASLKPGETAVSGQKGVHAEQKIMNHAQANGQTVNTIAPSRAACSTCAAKAASKNIKIKNP
jgi:hypothetical protein